MICSATLTFPNTFEFPYFHLSLSITTWPELERACPNFIDKSYPRNNAIVNAIFCQCHRNNDLKMVKVCHNASRTGIAADMPIIEAIPLDEN